MKEVDRLAAIISKIDEDMGVAPRGAYLRTPLNEIIVNKSFQGTCTCMYNTKSVSISEARGISKFKYFEC